MTRLGRSLAWMMGVAVLFLLTGCGGASGAPKTHPVQGKVVFKGKGGNIRHLVGGRVRLRSVSDPGVGAAGEIQEDGTFTLGTYLKEKSLPGAPAGTYKVVVDPPADDDDDDRRRRAVIHPKYRDFDKSGLTITVPVEKEVVLEVEPFGR